MEPFYILVIVGFILERIGAYMKHKKSLRRKKPPVDDNPFGWGRRW